ncbi:hypothetical protein ScPMuIL_014355 [Solemya velum]
MNNIRFGETYEKKKYNQVLESCALGSDLEILSGGDQTEKNREWEASGLERKKNLNGNQPFTFFEVLLFYSSGRIKHLSDGTEQLPT